MRRAAAVVQRRLCRELTLCLALDSNRTKAARISTVIRDADRRLCKRLEF